MRKIFLFHTLRIRILALLIAAMAPLVVLAAAWTVSLQGAARLDAQDAVSRLASTAALLDEGDFTPEGIGAYLPQGAAYGLIDQDATVIARGPDTDLWTRKPLPESALAREILSRKTGTLEAEGIDGIRRLYAFTAHLGDSSDGAYAYVGIPVAETAAVTRAVTARNIAFSSFLGLVVFGLALILGDFLIHRKVRMLASATRRIASGELGAAGDLPYGMSELDQLSELFEAMAEKLRGVGTATEETIKKRTVELEFNKGMAELEKARIEALLASIGEGVVATDKEGKVIFANKWAETLVGLEAKFIVGRPIYQVMVLEDEKGGSLPVEKQPAFLALSTGKKVESPHPPKPFSVVKADKKRFPAHVTVTPITLNEQTIGAIAVFRDITDEMEIDRRKSEFISIASHQLRSPLTGIKWLVDMLRKGDLGKLEPKQQKVADQLFDANERLVTLVNELLNVSRLEVGTTKPDPVDTDMNKLFAGIIADAEPVLAAKRQKLAASVDALPTIKIDPLLTREVVANILSNASKYSPDDSTVTIAVKLQPDDILISVSDQGIGIPPADQKKMFQKFFRAENAARSSITGTGLGLYVVKSVVELSGGKIWFDSEVGKGTTFHVTLPLKPPAQSAAKA